MQNNQGRLPMLWSTAALLLCFWTSTGFGQSQAEQQGQLATSYQVEIGKTWAIDQSNSVSGPNEHSWRTWFRVRAQTEQRLQLTIRRSVAGKLPRIEPEFCLGLGSAKDAAQAFVPDSTIQTDSKSSVTYYFPVAGEYLCSIREDTWKLVKGKVTTMGFVGYTARFDMAR